MKVSYIIMPFENAEYLIRCINSLYRQLGDDYEVILAENSLKEDSLEFLAERPQVKRISEMSQTAEEKLSEAVAMLAEDCGYVQLIDVNTVVSPIMARVVLQCVDADLIVPAVAVRDGDEFALESADMRYLLLNFDVLRVDRFCFSREMFNDNIHNFAVFFLSTIAENKQIKFIDDVCMYTTCSIKETDISTDIWEVSCHCDYIVSNFLEMGDAEMQSAVLEKITDKLLSFFGDEEKEIREIAFSKLKKIAGKVRYNVLFRKILEGKIGLESDDFLELNYEEFALYKSMVLGRDNPVSAVDISVQGKLISTMKASLDSLKNEVTALKSRLVIVPAQYAPAMSDPSVEVPRMYREGRLGLKTIMRSFNGWLKYKIGRNK